MTKHGLTLRCWTCGRQHDVRALGDCHGAEHKDLPSCCFDTLMEVASVFGRAVFHHLPAHVHRLKDHSEKFRDAMADAGVTSSDPEIRRAAQQWRNERAKEKSEKNGGAGSGQ